ncbi:MAG: hypothetical protein ACRDN9_19815 [Streptosporangiaceae bacterium]
MRDVLVTVETWTFDCATCSRIWSQDYEVWHTYDHNGGEVVVWHRGGFACLPPWSGIACPHCDGLRVKIRPNRTSPHEVRRIPGDTVDEARRAAPAAATARGDT